MSLLVHFLYDWNQATGLLRVHERRVAEAIVGIGFTNPVLPERIEQKKRALSKSFQNPQPFLQYRPESSVAEMFLNTGPLRKRRKPIAQSQQLSEMNCG